MCHFEAVEPCDADGIFLNTTRQMGHVDVVPWSSRCGVQICGMFKVADPDACRSRFQF